MHSDYFFQDVDEMVIVFVLSFFESLGVHNQNKKLWSVSRSAFMIKVMNIDDL